MSTTTIENPDTQSLGTVLADYKLHYSTVTHQNVSDASAVEPQPAPSVRNPPDWPTNHRRVPPYRPINRDLDLSQRIVFQNNVERGFVNTMFFGLRLVTLAHRLWRATGGKINDQYFRYKVGGEY
ncbi:hypothetical protein F5X98DRAFT_386696 [Xylaria grammica]|nr:hypothetical protein F5X98DRAFT_386696 [Xylaria grammica]